MNHLLRPRIWPSFLASSGVGPCDVPFRYASKPTPCGCQVARHLRSLATAIHEISGLGRFFCHAHLYRILLSRVVHMSQGGDFNKTKKGVQGKVNPDRRAFIKTAALVGGAAVVTGVPLASYFIAPALKKRDRQMGRFRGRKGPRAWQC